MQFALTSSLMFVRRYIKLTITSLWDYYPSHSVCTNFCVPFTHYIHTNEPRWFNFARSNFDNHIMQLLFVNAGFSVFLSLSETAKIIREKDAGVWHMTRCIETRVKDVIAPSLAIAGRCREPLQPPMSSNVILFANPRGERGWGQIRLGVALRLVAFRS